MSDIDDYIPVEDVANRLKLSIRQATRYADRMRTQRRGRRIFFHREDVETLAQELGAEYRPPPPPRTEMVPVGELVQAMERQQERIAALERERGRLEGILQSQQRLLEDADETRRKLDTAQAELLQLRGELEQQRRPWWKRLLDR